MRIDIELNIYIILKITLLPKVVQDSLKMVYQKLKGGNKIKCKIVERLNMVMDVRHLKLCMLLLFSLQPL